jgi:hypothetical protein
LFPERLRIELAPAEPARAEEPWQGALAAFKQALPADRKCDLTVVLSNHFVRYALVPWADALSTAAEEEAYLRHHFARIHGERAKAWALRSSEAPRGAPRLASAVDKTLIEALRACFVPKAKARLVSVQPALMAMFNRARGAVPKSGAWLALAEPERACVALHVQGHWRAVQSAKGPWLGLLERMRLSVEGVIPNLVLLHAGSAAQGDAPGWNVERLA